MLVCKHTYYRKEELNMARERKEKSEFGTYLAGAISEANMVQSDFYTAVGIKKPYFYDILTGKTNPPPRDTLEKMLDVLEKSLPPDENRRSYFFNLAAKGRKEIPVDINDLIKAHPERWDDIRIKLFQMFE